MAGDETLVTVVTVATTKKCRPRPIRKTVRSVVKASEQPADQAVNSEHICHGPSFLHNFLPILEPLLTLNPKLLYIEDHILGRKQTTPKAQPFTLPSSSDYPETWVEKASPGCNCDICAPHLYQLSSPKSHGTITYHLHLPSRSSPRFSHGYSIISPMPLPALRLKLYGHYEAMRLVRNHTAWLTSTYLSLPSNSQSHLLPPPAQHLASLLHAWKANLSGADLRQSLSIVQLNTLFTHLNRVFFFGAIPAHREGLSNGFGYLGDGETKSFGIGSYSAVFGTQVLLHPVLYRGQRQEPHEHHEQHEQQMHHHWNHNDSDLLEEVMTTTKMTTDMMETTRRNNRLGTILHELCHAFLKAYTCRACPMHDVTIGCTGHGRAWQLLAEHVERVAERIVGGQVDLGRYAGWVGEVEGGKG